MSFAPALSLNSYGSCPCAAWAAPACAWQSCRCPRKIEMHTVLQVTSPHLLSNEPRHYSATTVTQGAQGTTCDLLKGPLSPRMVVWCSQRCRRSHGHGCAVQSHWEPQALLLSPRWGGACAGLLSCCWCFSGLAASLGNKVPNQSKSKWGGTWRTALTFLPASRSVSRAIGLQRLSLLSSQMNRSNGHATAAS